ncbi:MAG: hypothetical protein AABX10_00315 [Nanoarchaeota archaeon]
MNKVFIAGSRRFHEEIKNLSIFLGKNKIDVRTSGDWNSYSKDTLKTEKKALFDAFKGIDKANILYVYAKDGYVGKTVAMEISYAYARKKKIISSEEIKELSAKALINKVIKKEKLITYLIN